MKKKVMFAIAILLIAIPLASSCNENTVKQERWEYKVERMPDRNEEEFLNALGMEGWEFISMPALSEHCIFKRRLL